MTEQELLKKIKSGLGITGDYQDEALQFYIDEVKGFMRSTGVSEEVLNGSQAVGCIMRGVADLWNYGSGSVKLSEYFIQRVLQLAAGAEKAAETTGGGNNA